MKKILHIFILFFICCSCSTNYYFCTTSSETSLYSKNKEKGNVITFIPAGVEIKVKGHSKYQKVKYKNFGGWVNTSNLIYPNTKLSKSKNTNSKTRNSQQNLNSRGTVSVKGYYRKDGTYVRPHTRSKPKSSYKRKKY
ncbi:MAG: hypothetical protein V7655_04480 [Aequorivita antarctica]